MTANIYDDIRFAALHRKPRRSILSRVLVAGAIAASLALIGHSASDAASFVNGQLVAVDGGFDAAGIGLPSYQRALGDA